MPIFEYKCDECGTHFEKLMRASAGADGLECPGCASKRLTKQLSTFAAQTNGAPARSEMPACPGGMCRTPSVCGRN